MNRAHIVLKLSLWLSILMVGVSGYATSEHEEKATLVMEILYPHDLEMLVKYEPHLEVTLLADDDDLLKQLDALQEQSKPELEPLVKQYMYAAEVLNQVRTGKITNQQQQGQLIQSFTITETRIQQTLERYTPMITNLLQRHTRQKIYDAPLLTTTLSFHDLAPGRYRVYGVLTYTTTTLTWFEPVDVKGGDCHTITFTRDNLNNPYWTTLNWWSFLNLNFSKHH